MLFFLRRSFPWAAFDGSFKDAAGGTCSKGDGLRKAFTGLEEVLTVSGAGVADGKLHPKPY